MRLCQVQKMPEFHNAEVSSDAQNPFFGLKVQNKRLTLRETLTLAGFYT